MPAEVESMMFVGRETPWHGLGVSIESAPLAEDAIVAAGLDWNVRQDDLFLPDGRKARGFRANVRATDGSILGVVTDRYRVVQNAEAFGFVDELLGRGVRYETAGSLKSGKRVWMLAILPDQYKVLGDDVLPYLVLTNSHDGKGGISVAMTPIRVVCQNTLNLALNTADRVWKTKHIGNFTSKAAEASRTIRMGEWYMKSLAEEAENMAKVKITEFQVHKFVKELFPISEDAGDVKVKNMKYMRDNLMYRYKQAPDLQGLGNNAYRFVNAVSDLATHQPPLRITSNTKENLFVRTIDGNDIINKAYRMVMSA